MEPSSHRNGTGRSFLAAVALACLLLFSGCGGSSASGGDGEGVELSEVEARLVEMQTAKSPDLEVQGAECPTDVELEEGSSFECIVTIEGVDAPYSVTLTEDDPEAGTGSFHIEPARAIIDVSIVVEFIRDQVDATAGDVDVECGEAKVLVADVGDEFDCTISDGKQVEKVVMVVKDIEGTVAVKE